MKKVNEQDRLTHEHQHAQILLKDPEGIWNWNSPAGRARAQRRADLIIQAGNIKSNSTTLEVGCGTGVFTQLVSQSGASITACELCQPLLEIASKKTYGSQIDFLNEDAMSLGGHHIGRYDVLWGSSVLHHLDLNIFLQRSLDLLKPGGRFVFAEPNMMNPQIFLERKIPYLRRRAGNSEDETAFVRWSLKKQLLKAGFINVSIYPHEFLHPAIPDGLIGFFQSVNNVLEHLWLIKEIAGSVLIKAEKPK
jgi:2-polyprenyl-3-methyl-5-hydroxy-6-metoxy-1,4-benzoquinol methylase